MGSGHLLRRSPRFWSCARSRCYQAAWTVFLPVALLPAQIPQSLLVLTKEERSPAKMMMRDWVKAQASVALGARRSKLGKLKTVESAYSWQEDRRRFFRKQLGGFFEKGPLNPRVTGHVSRAGCRIEKVLFDSLPGISISATLYLPLTPPPYPGVIVPCGHSVNGKAADTYQRASILLARNGLAALCFDPIGQGERNQALKDDGRRMFGSATVEHQLLAAQFILLGRNVATFEIWDGMRAIDYLQSRKDIDGESIGCTGNSGGGTQACYLMALDDRIDVAAPSCYVTSLEKLLASRGPQDAEQNIFGQIAFGLDHADYVIMRAPRPTLILAATQDFFDIEGTWDSYRQSKRFFGLLGHPERVDLVEADAKHGFSSLLRIGAVRWMRRWLLGVDDAIVEQEAKVLNEKELWSTPTGQVLRMDRQRRVLDVLIEEETALRRPRSDWRERDEEKFVAEVRRLAGIETLADLPRPKLMDRGEVDFQGMRLRKFLFDRGDGIRLPALLFDPGEPSGPPVIYLHGEGKHAAVSGPIASLVKAGRLVLAVDVRGIGETRNSSGRSDHARYVGSDWQDLFGAFLLGRSHVGMRAEDILVCSRWLARQGDGNTRVEMVAVGRLSVPALHAAALEPSLFSAVSIRGGLRSWADVVRSPRPIDQLANAVHGALAVYDLPDLEQLLGDKLRVEDARDAVGEALR